MKSKNKLMDRRIDSVFERKRIKKRDEMATWTQTRKGYLNMETDR